MQRTHMKWKLKKNHSWLSKFSRHFTWRHNNSKILAVFLYSVPLDSHWIQTTGTGEEYLLVGLNEWRLIRSTLNR